MAREATGAKGRLRRILAERQIEGSDIVMAAMGVGLAAVCAFFPWYIFLNQEKFGPPAMHFSGKATAISTGQIVAQPELISAPSLAEQAELDELDLFATGTVPDEEPGDLAAEAVDQPFPDDAPLFEVVHIANGRAMIADDSGLWVVQTGSSLPDASTVKAIEHHQGKWVLVNSNDRVFEMQ